MTKSSRILINRTKLPPRYHLNSFSIPHDRKALGALTRAARPKLPEGKPSPESDLFRLACRRASTCPRLSDVFIFIYCLHHGFYLFIRAMSVIQNESSRRHSSRPAVCPPDTSRPHEIGIRFRSVISIFSFVNSLSDKLFFVEKLLY